MTATARPAAPDAGVGAPAPNRHRADARPRRDRHRSGTPSLPPVDRRADRRKVGSSDPSDGRGSFLERLRFVFAVTVTTLIVIAEFALLHWTYQRAVPVRDAAVVSTRAVTLFGATHYSPKPGADTPALVVVRQLVDSAGSQVSVDELQTAIDDYAAGPSPTAFGAMADAAIAVDTELKHKVHRLDLEADVIFGALLVGATLGWMFWFRRRIERSRRLEREITERHSRTIGAQRLAALVRTSADAILVCDAGGAIGYVSPSVQTVLGVESANLQGRRVADLIEPDDRRQFRLVLGRLGGGDEATVRMRMPHADGHVVDVEGTATNLVDDPVVGGMVITIRDVTERSRLEGELRRQAFHDSLTNLANRQLFSDRLEQALHARRIDDSRSLVVLFLDLDEFKNVNDSLGHGAGDKVLVEVAERARRLVRPGDTVARFGGDEFAILFDNADMEQAVAIAERLLASLNLPMQVAAGHSMVMGGSIGLAAADGGNMTSEEILRNADVAMYLAKGRGKGTIAIYDSELHARALRGMSLRANLEGAIARGEIQPYFQPTVDVRTSEVVGFEALARWVRPDRSVVAPADFIPIAEQTGLIHQLGHDILLAACRHAVEFNKASVRQLSMAVNITAQQLAREDFVDEVLHVLRTTGLEPSALVLEITESALVQELAVVEERLRTLRRHHVRIAIDDFGTGFSSLSYLRQLPVDALKVDKAFIDRVASDAHDAAVTRAIIMLSRSVELTTVAEGVEHQDQAEWLAGTDCAYAQGYLWSQPLPAAQALALVSRRSQALTGSSSAS